MQKKILELNKIPSIKNAVSTLPISQIDISSYDLLKEYTEESQIQNEVNAQTRSTKRIPQELWHGINRNA